MTCENELTGEALAMTPNSLSFLRSAKVDGSFLPPAQRLRPGCNTIVDRGRYESLHDAGFCIVLRYCSLVETRC